MALDRRIRFLLVSALFQSGNYFGLNGLGAAIQAIPNHESGNCTRNGTRTERSDNI
jgi:hypothetical protein